MFDHFVILALKALTSGNFAAKTNQENHKKLLNSTKKPETHTHTHTHTHTQGIAKVVLY